MSAIGGDPAPLGQTLLLEDKRGSVQAVLESDLFRKSPNLSRLLQYLAAQTFAGSSGELKEFNIAVEALARPDSFNPQLDSIVRVEMFNLRKRLKRYYESEGALALVRITIPLGQYSLSFTPSESNTLTDSPSVEPTEDPLSHEPNQPGPPLLRWSPTVIAVSIVLVTIGVAAVAFLPTIRDRNRLVKIVPPPGFELRIACGEHPSDYTDSSGRIWLTDRYFIGGEVFVPQDFTAARTADPALYKTGRKGTFEYAIPVPPGRYELRLHFAEPELIPETSRSVLYTLNFGSTINRLDLVADAAGPRIATIKVIRNVSPLYYGNIHIQFNSSSGLIAAASFLNAIEVLSSPHGKMNPVRVSTSSSSIRDKEGKDWLPDQFFLGGRSGRFQKTNVSIPAHLRQERIGNFSYAIPVIPGGLYSLRLHFVEQWYGEGNEGATEGGAGMRIFDVYCNGQTLLKDFDVLKESGQPRRILVKTFSRIPSSAQGKLLIQFVPIKNYAMVNAIEVEEQ